jgi:CheY-like chemotaxis protein
MSKTILCTDDSATMLKVAEITFAATEYRYVGARTVDDALKLARSEKPALILADAVMPGKNGYDLCRAIKSDSDLSSTPVLIMCGNSQAYDGARGEAAGADGHVTKPWDTQVMLDKVAETIARIDSEGAARLGQGEAAATTATAPPTSRTPRAPTPPPMASAPPTPRPPSAVPLAPARAPTASPAPPRPATPVPAMPQPPRSATIMGMPTFPMPPAEAMGVAPAAAPTPPAAAPSPSAPPVRAAGSANDGAAPVRPPMIKGQPQRRLRLVPISEVAAQVASEHGLDVDSPEMQALVKLSREVVERIVWEVVPDLAEMIIKQNLDRLTTRASGGGGRGAS